MTLPCWQWARYVAAKSQAMAEQEILHKTFRSSADFLHDLRQSVKAACVSCQASPQCLDSLVMAANEAFANIIEHGYGEQEEGEVLVRITHTDKEIRISLQDKAPHVNLKNMYGRDPTDLQPGGLGLFFIRQLMDRVEYPQPKDGKGNIMVLVKKKH